MKKFIIYYNFLLTSIMLITGFFSAKNIPELISAVFFFPISIYFLDKILPRHKSAIILPLEIIPKQTKKILNKFEKGKELKAKESVIEGKIDVDRRTFLKLIGSAGLSIFILSIFSGRAHGAFFGSIPGPGTVSLKNTSGVKIDPAVEHPTDRYKISEIDDATPSYYGFLDAGGAWYILKENSDGTYRYASGSSNFSTNWSNRTSLTYDYYHNVF